MKNYSQGEIECMSIYQYMFSSNKNDFLWLHNGEKAQLIPNRKYDCDGYHPLTKTVVEYHGCYWHGCPFCEKDNINKKDNYKSTLEKREIHLEEGFNYVEIWECNFQQKQSLIYNLKCIFNDVENIKPSEIKEYY